MVVSMFFNDNMFFFSVCLCVCVCVCVCVFCKIKSHTDLEQYESEKMVT